jgi:hypothetical protein
MMQDEIIWILTIINLTLNIINNLKSITPNRSLKEKNL